MVWKKLGGNRIGPVSRIAIPIVMLAWGFNDHGPNPAPSIQADVGHEFFTAKNPIERGSNSGGKFPLSVSPNGRYLVTADGQPFLFHGEAAWSLIAQLTIEEAETYLADRASRGVQVIIVELIEHFYAVDPPRNAYGEDPFLTPGDFTTPNEAYFAHADAVLQLAEQYGMAVLLFPAYAGFNGGSSGWWAEMSALTREQCRQYGEFLGQRYANQQNLIWVSGGDFTIPTGTPGEACALALRDGILAIDNDALHTTHYSPETNSLTQPTFADSVEINGVYTYSLTYPAVASAYENSTLPVFLLESHYEGELRTLPDWRAQSWWAMLSGAVGQISGNNPIWLFDPGWESALDSPLSQDMTHLRNAFDGWEWWRLVPNYQFVVSGAGIFQNPDFVTASVTDDGRLGLIYFPPGGSPSRSITLDTTHMAGPVTASWLDPTNGVLRAAGAVRPRDTQLNTQIFTAPGANADGATDWVLVLEADSGVPIEVSSVGLSLRVTGAPRVGHRINYLLSEPEHPTENFILLLGVSGTSPGFPLGIGTFPLNPDILTEASLSGPATVGLSNSIGVLDADGGAIATLDLPLISALVGINLSAAFVTIDESKPPGEKIQEISNPVTVTLTF